MRRWLTGLLPDGPERDDLISVAVELGTNAVQHTASGDDGWFTVEVASLGPVIRVSITDEGGQQEPRLTSDPVADLDEDGSVHGDGESDHGRGLVIVRALAVACGVCGNASGRTVWAEVPQVYPPAGAGAESAAVPVQGRSSRPPASSVIAISRTL